RILIFVSTTLWLITAIICYFMPDAASFVFLAATTLILAVTLHDSFQKQHSLLRNYPLIARLRWVFEGERDKIKQYFIESDLDGTPINREKRSIIYQRAKKQIETIPFGTQHDVYQKGYEFVKHALFPKNHHQIKGERLTIGTEHCKQPYSSSLINISAMSFGSLSKAAVMALNQGAKLGGFAHNTGEGGISPYHLQGGDLIFQVGTGYFGAGKTDENGERVFDPECFQNNAQRPEVKLIEIKLSQGAKPGHGGILPASKNSEEIAKIRGIEPHTRVDSPPKHNAFNDAEGLLDFIKQCRQLSGGKPIGIKCCVGDIAELDVLFKTFRDAENYPDFISVDGAEGGTGSAPLEFTNYIGTPLTEGLHQVITALKAYGLKSKIKVIASGKAVDAFDVVRLLCLGADAVNMARSFMISVGCIQARECHTNTCPVGVATQDPKLAKALVVNKKNVRVKNYHEKTLVAIKEMVAAMGLDDIGELTQKHVFRRMDDHTIKSFEDLYPN
ncbi:MAG: FMN-binding glutamate synthase family protein, partial [Flavobacteriales bacterium]